MLKNRRYQKSRNKNRHHQESYDSPEGEGEFLNESNDSMLTVSDSLGNMDPLDSDMTMEIDRTLLDEFAGDSDLSADHNFPEGRDTASPRRSGASGRRPASRMPPRKTKDQAANSPKPPASRSSRMSPKAASQLKTRVEPMLNKVQGLMEPYRDDLSLRLKEVYGAAKARGKVLDQRIKTRPYVYAFGAIVAGFALAKIFTATPSTRR